jgi:hypothetical protein
LTEPDERPREPWEDDLEETFDDTPPTWSALGFLGHLIVGILIVAAIFAVIVALAYVGQWIFT